MVEKDSLDAPRAMRREVDATAAPGGTAGVLGPMTASVWQRFVDTEPGADFTRIYSFLEGS
jgi:3-hydroxyisobutyrate dehydrogenase